MATEQVPARTPERQAFYDTIAPANLAPLWENLHRMVTELPNFTGDAKASNEGKLEAIQMAWYEEWKYNQES